jgi:hypothetical protein
MPSEYKTVFKFFQKMMSFDGFARNIQFVVQPPPQMRAAMWV